MTDPVDSYRFVDPITRRVMQAWIDREPPREIPWVPLDKPLAGCVLATVSTAAISMLDDEPFDQAGERRNPWWGDPSFRRLGRAATAADVRVGHLHVYTAYPEDDINCVLPLPLLRELEAAGVIGRSADTHYSFMGYQLRTDALIDESTPQIVQGLLDEGVDAVLLVPV